MAMGGVMLVATKVLAVWVLAQTFSLNGGDFYQAALWSALLLAPSAVLEVMALYSGWRLARGYVEGGIFDQDLRAQAKRLSYLLYFSFFAASLGLLAAGYLLDLGMAVAAPALAPLAPLAVASGAVRLLTIIANRGAELDEEAKLTV
jgi:hypothetical protein